MSDNDPLVVAMDAYAVAVKNWALSPSSDTFSAMYDATGPISDMVIGLRARVAELEGARDGLAMQRTMTVHRLGGMVEGAPTHAGNFLQRVDALCAVERAARAVLDHWDGYDEGEWGEEDKKGARLLKSLATALAPAAPKGDEP